MKRKLNKIAKDTNLFLKRFIAKQKKSNLMVAMKYGLFSGGKKIRSKILVDVGSIFNLDYKTLIVIGAAGDMSSVWAFSDAMILALVFPNMIGLFILFPKVREELQKYINAISAKKSSQD